MKTYKITFTTTFNGVESEEQAYDIFLDYLKDCVRNEDLTGFDFEEVTE